MVRRLILLFFFNILLVSISIIEDRRLAEATRIAEEAIRIIEKQAELGRIVERVAKRHGLVDIRQAGVAAKDFPFAHPRFIWLLKEMREQRVHIWRVTEGYPPTVKHVSRGHYNGRAIDLTLRNAKQASKVCRWINKQPGFKCVNEYKKKYKHSTGKHLHIAYSGP